MKKILLITFLFFEVHFSTAQILYVKGVVKDAIKDNQLQGVVISIDSKNIAITQNNGTYFISVIQANNFRLKYSLIGYKPASQWVAIDNFTDTISINIDLIPETYILPSVDISAKRKVDTVFGTWKFSVSDYEFYDENIIMLVFKKNLKQPSLVLCDYSQNVIFNKKLNFEAVELFKDYLGNVFIIGTDENYYVSILKEGFVLEKISKNDFDVSVKPVLYKHDFNIYFSNYTRNYPEFTYYSYNSLDSSVVPIRKITDEKLLLEYNFELYFLKPRDRTYARKIAKQYNLDIHFVAANMTGLTSSIFYEPLYEPLFIIRDTLNVFNHCNNKLIKLDKKFNAVDSISINYHHPKNWREWKHKLIIDDENKNVYALFQKNGFYYLKRINIYSGEIDFSFKLSNQYVECIKIKNNHVYYVYRPFESLQEQFLYKELIIN